MKNSDESATGPGRAEGNALGHSPPLEPIPLLDIEDDDDPASFLVDLEAADIEPVRPASGAEPTRFEQELELLPAEGDRDLLPDERGLEPSDPGFENAMASPEPIPDRSRTEAAAARPAAENLPARPASWCSHCGVRHASGDCAGEVLAREPERHGFKLVVETPAGKKVHGVLLAPAGDGWRARIMTYPKTLWVVPGGIRTIKFLAPDPEQAENLAVDFLHQHCAERNHQIVDDPALEAHPEPIELEQTEFVDEIEATRRKPRSVLVRFGPDKPNRKGNTADLSAKGMFIATSELYARGTSLRILLELAGARIPLRGVVKWTRSSAAPGRPGGMGIELIRPPAFYSQYIGRLP